MDDLIPIDKVLKTNPRVQELGEILKIEQQLYQTKNTGKKSEC